jgi:hypothetical protein
MKQNNDFNWIYSIPIIFLAFIFFWPLGVFLLIRKITAKPTPVIRSGKLPGISGNIFIAIALIGIIVGMTDWYFTFEDFKMISLFGLSGLALKLHAKNLKKESARFHKYISIIVNQNIYDLQKIASISALSYNEVKNDLQKMINDGHLKDAYIDEGARSIVLPDSFSYLEKVSSTPFQKTMNREKAGRVVVCPSCGAKNVVYNKIVECEYCDTPLQ